MPASTSVLLNRLLARGKFRHVQVLLKLAELGSLQRTAVAIGMTQSSVTQTLAYLERLLDAPLFERHARGVRPTPACKDLLPVARQVLLGITEGAEVIAARQNRGEGVVRIAASVTAIHGLLVDPLSRFGQHCPGISVHLTEAEGDDQLLAIARGEVDLVACRRPPVVPEGWTFTALRADRFAVVCRADHPLVDKRGLTWPKLADQTWLMTPAGTAARERFDDLAATFAGPVRMHPVTSRSLTMLWWLLRCGEVVAFVPINFARPLIDRRELRELDVRPASPIEPLGLLRPVGALTLAAQRLAGYLEAAFPGGLVARVAVDVRLR